VPLWRPKILHGMECDRNRDYEIRGPRLSTGWRTKYDTIDCARNTFLLLQKHLTSGTELILIGWKIVPNEEHVQCEAREAWKCSATQGPHNEVVPRAFWRLASKSCDECKGSFARGCEAKRWSHWTCSSLGTIFQPMRINSVPDVKCFCNNKNVLRSQSMVWHLVRHPVCEIIMTARKPLTLSSNMNYT